MAAERDDLDRRRALAEAVEAARVAQGLSISAAVSKAAGCPETKIGRTKWTQIESASAPLPSKATIGKVARVLHIDSNVLLAAAGYSSGPDVVITDTEGNVTAIEVKTPNVFISHSSDVDVTQLIAYMAEALQELRAEIRSMSSDLRSLVVTFQPQSPDVVPPSPRTLREARQRGARVRTPDHDSRT